MTLLAVGNCSTWNILKRSCRDSNWGFDEGCVALL